MLFRSVSVTKSQIQAVHQWLKNKRSKTEISHLKFPPKRTFCFKIFIIRVWPHPSRTSDRTLGPNRPPGAPKGPSPAPPPQVNTPQAPTCLRRCGYQPRVSCGRPKRAPGTPGTGPPGTVSISTDTLRHASRHKLLSVRWFGHKG